MRILIINGFGNNAIKETDILPRVGDMVDLFYKPYPTVSRVLLYPSVESITAMGAGSIDAVITVD